MTVSFEVECIDCGDRRAFHPLAQNCPACQSDWAEVRYDLAAVQTSWSQSLHQRPFDLWRYHELLPVRDTHPALTMGEGGTPLLKATNLGRLLGLKHLYIKDERQGPTASFKDRQAVVSVAGLVEAGLREVVVASTGNVAIAYSAYCARAGIKLWAFITSLVPAPKMHEIGIFGSQLIKVASTYDQAKKLAANFAEQRELYIDRGTRSVAAVESMKTIAFEIAEQLAIAVHAFDPARVSDAPWCAPDWYIQAVSGGIGPVGVLKGFDELTQMGRVLKPPALACIQSEGCAPMVEAWKRGEVEITPVVSPTTRISTLSTGDPGRTYTLLRTRITQGSGGVMESVSDEEAFQAMHTLAKMEGLSIEPAAAVAFAGLFKLVRSRQIEADQVVVVNCSGHTMPIEKSILGDGWIRDLALPSERIPEQPEEGLLSALELLDRQRIQKILIVDDHEDARRLICRILQTQGDYIIMEAEAGMQALKIAQEDTPHLIILDLMMPEMDGFTVLEMLQKAPETAEVPIIVVTAKQLTAGENARLRGRISRLMTKGNFLDEELIAEINQVLDQEARA